MIFGGCCACLRRLCCGLFGDSGAEGEAGCPGVSPRTADYRPPTLQSNHLALTQSFEEEHTGQSPLLPKCSRTPLHSCTAELLNAAVGAQHGVAQTSSCSTPAASFSHPNSSMGHKARHRRTGSEASKFHLQQYPQQHLRASVLIGGQAAAKQQAAPPMLSDAEKEKAAAKLGLSSGASVKGDEDDSYYCPTCLEPYAEDNPKTFTACGHHFHVPCLFEWMERKDTCPICESKLQFEGLD
uniref:RING-type E3 ubiquitin transferase n=1 Tax=Dunaliella tertiolecta TaxID=3047 RepID=A0A7S3VHJ0_DUNTE|mmetsp:Transcript_5055/g.11983  ORF Transcript_5055/g.11983 Transcript_5055/m.11983 type:complete len:240 (+) Transcript_5055:128-847(+)